MTKLYLRPNAVARPLLNHWILWDMLLPPAQAALIIARNHLPIMESYLRAPQQHADAASTPALMGGPWMNYPTPRVDEIRDLLNRTRKVQGEMLALAGAIAALDDLLRRHAKGESLEPLYSQIPAPLRGYVELVYDLDDHPGMRLFEGMLYRSRYCGRALQHFAVDLVERDWLPYERSTPVLDDGRRAMLALPWNDARLDALFAAEHTPVDIDEMGERLGLDAARTPAWRDLFTDVPPLRRHAPPSQGVRVRYFGHACVLIESPETSILTDPFVSYEYPTDLPRYTFEDLPQRIDYLVITHGHSDHIRPEVLLRLRHRTGTVVVPHCAGRRLQDPSLKLMLQELGFANVVEMRELDSISLPGGGALTAVPFVGEHSDLDIQGKSGYHVQLHGRSVACLADSCSLDPMMYRHIAAELGPVDLLFLGMECEGSPMSWGYGHLLMRKPNHKADQSRRDRGSNAAEAKALIEAWPAAQAYVYAMGQEPWLNHVLAIDQSGGHLGISESDDFLAHCRSRGIDGERLYGCKEIVLPAR
ncbi:MBL fold metallo-hydrolase [Variovorax boronicumulans]|uniref:MBL fold metallo-hydrolase n=1 Tax=Variovorax boronicumulans TaxID=436515 RepID=UPI00339A1583